MSIDPNTLPEGAVVEANAKYGAALGPMTVRYLVPTDTITRVFVPVPDGMTLADAEAALADAGAWVEVEDFHDIPKGARCRSEWSRFAGKPSRSYVHRDDLPPTDPDAELVKKMARALYPAHEGTEHLGDAWENVARAALAVVREHEAKS